MPEYGSREEVKRALHLTNINNMDGEIDTYLQQANGYIIDKMVLLTGGSSIITDSTKRKRLNDFAEQFAIVKYRENNVPNYNGQKLDTVKREIKDHIEAFYVKRTEGISHRTFGKTDSKITTSRS